MKSSKVYTTTAWKWFGKYIILKYSNNGVVQCCTSKRWYSCNDKNIHAGHLIKVDEGGGNTNYAVAFDERNVLPQSHSENVHKGGNQLKMLDEVERIHGKGTYDDLRQKARFPFKLDKVTLKMIAEEYKAKFKELEKEKGNPWK